jgi:hypothetical protein
MCDQSARQRTAQADFINHSSSQRRMQRLELAELKRSLIASLHDRPSQDPQRDLCGEPAQFFGIH